MPGRAGSGTDPLPCRFPRIPATLRFWRRHSAHARWAPRSPPKPGPGSAVVPEPPRERCPGSGRDGRPEIVREWGSARRRPPHLRGTLFPWQPPCHGTAQCPGQTRFKLYLLRHAPSAKEKGKKKRKGELGKIRRRISPLYGLRG